MAIDWETEVRVYNEKNDTKFLSDKDMIESVYNFYGKSIHRTVYPIGPFIMSHSTILNRMHFWGLKTQCKFGDRYLNTKKEKFLNLGIDYSKFTRREIAKMVGCTRSWISTLCKRYDINYIREKNRFV